MSVKEAEKLFEIIEAAVAHERARNSSDGGLNEGLILSQLQQEFLDMIMESQSGN